LEGEWETDDLIKRILEESHRPNNKIVFDTDPKALVERVIEMIKIDKAEMNLVHKNDDNIGGTGKNDERLL
jgi:hypothetical protein